MIVGNSVCRAVLIQGWKECPFFPAKLEDLRVHEEFQSASEAGKKMNPIFFGPTKNLENKS